MLVILYKDSVSMRITTSWTIKVVSLLGPLWQVLPLLCNEITASCNPTEELFGITTLLVV